jgi:L-asparaginase
MEIHHVSFVAAVFLFCSVLTGVAGNAEAADLPKVAILATGGTIAGQAASSTQLTGYTAAVLTPEQLIAVVPDMNKFASISAEQMASVDSKDMTVELWLKLAKRINELLAGDVDGIVVTHGTDTMEETAYFLNLVVKSHKPVVLVGAMRPASSLSADGPLNLLQSVAVAGDKNAAGRGVMIIMSNVINSARDATKTNTTQVETFRSHDFGILGYVVDNRPVFYRQTTRRHTADTEFDVSALTALPRVEIVYNYVDPGLDALKGILAAGPAGIVSAGTGDGSLFTPFEKLLTEAAMQGIAVVRSSRTGSGVVAHTGIYDEAENLLSSDTLNPQKARVLLMLALTKTKNFKEIARMFNTY